MMLINKEYLRLFCLGGLLVMVPLFYGCHTVRPTHPTAGSQIVQEMEDSIAKDKRRLAARSHPLPSNVDSSLLPPLSHYIKSSGNNADARFDVSANKLPAREFFMSLVAGTKYNMVVRPEITGTITLDLKNVTIAEALDAVRDTYGYEFHKTTYGYEVLPRQLENRIFHVNYLDIQRTGRSYIELNTGQVSSVGTITVGGSQNNNLPNTQQLAPGTASPNTISSVETKSDMQFWKTLQKSIEDMVGNEEGHRVTVNAQAGVIAVRAYPNELKTVYRFLNSLQASLNRQVILEAKILEVQLDDEYQAGIDWSVLGNPALLDSNGNPLDSNAGIGQGGTNSFADTTLNRLTGGIFAIRVKGNFKTLVEILQTQGNVQVLSSPHISTVNNQKAVIKVGKDEFFVTGVSTSNTIVGTNTIPSQDVSLTPFFSGITLDVTPEISSNNTIVLHIHPSISRVTEQTKVIGLGTNGGQANNLTLPLAKSEIRESDNVVRAKNGQVVIIGGLMQNVMTETIAGTPGLSKVPFLGALFRRTQQVAQKSELVILLRPVIASTKNINQTLEEHKKAFQSLKRPFHVGGLPKIFGNEAERDDND